MSSGNIRSVVPPNFPTAPKEYSAAWQDQFINVLRLYLNNNANTVNAPKVFGSYYDTTTQTNAAGTNLVTYNSTAVAYNTKIGSPTSRIFVSETGIFNIQLGIQLDKTGGGADTVWIWLRKNGTDVPDSAGKVVVSGPNGELITAWNYVLLLEANDYIELAWSSADATMVLPTIAASTVAPVHPEVPSVILTVTWVSNPPV